MLRTLIILITSFLFIKQAPITPTHSTVKGKASYYGVDFQGRKTANGEIYNRFAFTAAHRKLPFNTYLRVVNLKNQLCITVRVNDRGPYNYTRIIDLSEAAARRIGSYQHGLTTVEIEELDLIQHSPELDNIFLNNEVVDCLGNEEELGDFSLQLYKSTDLIHIIYLANELYLHNDVEKVLIVGNGNGNKRTYSIVISDYSSKEACIKAKDFFERKGFMLVSFFKQ